mmetsp:Transcript_112155/g.362129  ORF Transcript_112155/g.362129 Transcript_112155/m.362129 type:complete len:231 (+) Transcript_112155:394-1086(+)
MAEAQGLLLHPCGAAAARGRHAADGRRALARLPQGGEAVRQQEAAPAPPLPLPVPLRLLRRRLRDWQPRARGEALPGGQAPARGGAARHVVHARAGRGARGRGGRAPAEVERRSGGAGRRQGGPGAGPGGRRLPAPPGPRLPAARPGRRPLRPEAAGGGREGRQQQRERGGQQRVMPSTAPECGKSREWHAWAAAPAWWRRPLAAAARARQMEIMGRANVIHPLFSLSAT